MSNFDIFLDLETFGTHRDSGIYTAGLYSRGSTPQLLALNTRAFPKHFTSRYGLSAVEVAERREFSSRFIRPALHKARASSITSEDQLVNMALDTIDRPGSRLVGYNINFDLDHLNEAAKRASPNTLKRYNSIMADKNVVDVASIFRDRLSASYKELDEETKGALPPQLKKWLSSSESQYAKGWDLDTAAILLGITKKKRGGHTAEEDALLTSKILDKLDSGASVSAKRHMKLMGKNGIAIPKTSAISIKELLQVNASEIMTPRVASAGAGLIGASFLAYHLLHNTQHLSSKIPSQREKLANLPVGQALISNRRQRHPNEQGRLERY